MRWERNDMMRRYGAWRGVLTSVLILCLAPLLWSQEDPRVPSKGPNEAGKSLNRESVPANTGDPAGKEPVREPPPPDYPKADADPAGIQDPTQLPEELKILLRQDREAGRRSLKPVPPRLPLVNLKGMVLAEDKSALAMIEVDGRLVMIRENDEITTASPERTSLVIRVERISDTEVSIHVSPLDRKMILK